MKLNLTELETRVGDVSKPVGSRFNSACPEIKMKLDMQKLRTYEAQGLITLRKHPTANLLIANYTQKVQFDGLWDEYTEMCRGLITDLEGNIVARPFPKFFNLNTASRPETLIENLPAELPEVTDKLDGSLGILYFVDGEPCIATRGSFESEQAVWATKWLRDNVHKEFCAGLTYLFEIIYPANRIVVDYFDRAELVLLAVIETETGAEFPGEVISEALVLGLTPVEWHHAMSMDVIAKWVERLGPNEEGFVCRYSNGLRVKLKGSEYLRLHRLVTQCNARKIWECLANGDKLDDFLERVPDEFSSWVRATRDELLTQFYSTKVAANIAWRCVQDLPTRKEQAAALRAEHPDEMHLVFSLLDSKPIDELIWKRLRPAHETPWRQPREESAV